MIPPILNIADLPLQEQGHGERFQARFALIASRIGAKKLGYNLTVLAPGKRAFPFHSHRVNEEMFFVVAGQGEVRIGAERHPIRQGDVIACPPGGPETAHQIINNSDAELRYLAVSTKLSPEIAEYPDSGKFGVLAELSPATESHPAETFRFVGRTEGGLDYWDGEG